MEVDAEDVEKERELIRDKESVTTKYIFSGSNYILPRILFYYFDETNVTSFKVLAEYLLLMIDNNYVPIEVVNEHLMILMQHDDWTPGKLGQLSKLMKFVFHGQKDFTTVNNSKEGLLLDVLSELTANIDEFEEEF